MNADVSVCVYEDVYVLISVTLYCLRKMYQLWP